MNNKQKPVGVAKIIVMSSPPDISVASLDLDELYEWRQMIYRTIEILMDECVTNAELLLKEWRAFFMTVAFEIMHRIERTGPYSDS